MPDEFKFEERIEKIAAQRAEAAARVAEQAAAESNSLALRIAEIKKTHAEQRRVKEDNAQRTEPYLELIERFVKWAGFERIEPDSNTTQVIKPAVMKYHHGILCRMGLKSSSSCGNRIIEPAVGSPISLWTIASEETSWTSYDSTPRLGGEIYDSSEIHNVLQTSYSIGGVKGWISNKIGIYVDDKGPTAPSKLVSRSYRSNVFYDQEKILTGGKEVDALLGVVTPDMILNRVAQLALDRSLDVSKF